MGTDITEERKKCCIKRLQKRSFKDSIGLQAISQKNIKAYYADQEVGDYYADLLVEGKVIVELKAADAICEAHEAQLLNYLKATDVEVGLLLNFGKSPAFKRKIFHNQLKRWNTDR